MRRYQQIATAFALVLLSAEAGLAQDVMGVWRTESNEQGHLEIQFAPCGAAVCGTIHRAISNEGVAGPYPHLGRQMVWDMVPNGQNSWADGKIWDPRNDRTYNSRMVLNGATLQVSGCVLGICQGQDWSRVR